MLEVSSKVNGDVNEIAFVGRLDAKAARQAEEVFVTATDAAPNIVLDMSGLEYIASAGLRALKRLHSAVGECGGTLVLKGVQEDVMEVFEMTGFAAMLTIE